MRKFQDSLNKLTILVNAWEEGKGKEISIKVHDEDDDNEDNVASPRGNYMADYIVHCKS